MTYKRLHKDTYDNLQLFLKSNKKNIDIDTDIDSLFIEFIKEYRTDIFYTNNNKKRNDYFAIIKLLIKIIKKENAKKGKFL